MNRVFAVGECFNGPVSEHVGSVQELTYTYPGRPVRTLVSAGCPWVPGVSSPVTSRGYCVQ